MLKSIKRFGWQPVGRLGHNCLLCLAICLVQTVGHTQSPPVSAGEASSAESSRLRRIGGDLARAGDLPGAIAVFQQALKICLDSHDREGEARALESIGRVQYLSRDSTKAIQSIGAAQQIWQDLGNQQKVAAAQYLTGNAYLRMEEFGKALIAYRQSHSLYVQVNDIHGQLNSQLGIGLAYKNLGQYSKALEAYDEAVRLPHENEPGADARLNLSIGAVCFSQGDYKKSAEFATKALAVAPSLHDAEIEGEALRLLGQTHYSLGEYTQARDLYLKALIVQRAAHDKDAEASLLNNIGQVSYVIGTMDDALRYYRQALDIRKSIGSLRGQALSRNSVAQVFVAKGEYQKAIEEYTIALALSQQTSYQRGIARSYDGLGAAAFHQGDPVKAMSFYFKAAEIQKKTTDRGEYGRSLTHIALLNRDLGRNRDAIGYVQEALGIFEEIGARADRALALNLSAAIYRDLGRSDEALQAAKTAVDVYHEIEIPSEEAASLNLLAIIYMDIGKDARAQPLLQRSLDLRKTVRDRSGEAVTMNSLAQLNARNGRISLALAQNRTVLEIRREVHDETGEAVSLFNLGAMYERIGDYSQALYFYEQSIDLIEKLRSSPKSETTTSPFGAEVYMNAILLHLRLNQNAKAFDLTERSRARSFLYQIGNAHIEAYRNTDPDLLRSERELRERISASQRRLYASLDPNVRQKEEISLEGMQRDYSAALMAIKGVSPEYHSLIALSPLKLKEIQLYLTVETTLISYFVTPDEVLRFTITSNSMTVDRVSVTKKELREAVQSIYLSKDKMEEACARLSRWLLPSDPRLLRTTVVLIPHTELQMVPFAALPLGSNRLLGADHVLSALPSASTLQFLRSQGVATGKMLSVAQSHPFGFPLLPDADSEAKQVAAIYGEPAVVDINDSQFVAKVQSSDLVHVVAHGELKLDNPLFSRIVLGASSTTDGSLYLQKILSLNLGRTGLVVLSACETARGEVSEGDDVTSLSRAFLAAGASTVIASLWQVQDNVAAKLMVPFYKYLRLGMSKGAALAKAQEDVRADFPHPYYWAGFVLSGDSGSGVAAVP